MVGRRGIDRFDAMEEILNYKQIRMTEIEKFKKVNYGHRGHRGKIVGDELTEKIIGAAAALVLFLCTAAVAEDAEM